VTREEFDNSQLNRVNRLYKPKATTSADRGKEKIRICTVVHEHKVRALSHIVDFNGTGIQALFEL
jgi:hypothetical protein